MWQISYICAEGFQRAIGKPFGRLRRGENPLRKRKAKRGLSPALHKERVSCERFRPTYIVGMGPEGVQGAIGKPPGRLGRGEIPCEKGKQRRDFPLPSTRNVFLVRGFAHVYRDGPRRGPGGDRKAPWSHPQVRNPAKRERQERLFPLPSTRNVFLVRGFAHVYRDGPRRGPGGDRKAPWSHPQVRNPAKREKQERLFPLPSTRNVFLVRGFAHVYRDVPRRGPGGDRKAPWSHPQVRNPAKREKQEKLFSPAFHKECVSCERFRPPAGGRGTFPARESTQRAPGAAKGCMSRGRPRTPRC